MDPYHDLPHGNTVGEPPSRFKHRTSPQQRAEERGAKQWAYVPWPDYLYDFWHPGGSYLLSPFSIKKKGPSRISHMKLKRTDFIVITTASSRELCKQLGTCKFERQLLQPSTRQNVTDIYVSIPVL